MDWYSGAGEHMTANRDWIKNYRPVPDGAMEIVLGDDSTVPVAGIGTVYVLNEYNRWIAVEPVLHVPKLKRNLFSISEVEEKGYTVVVKDGRLEIIKGKTKFLTGNRIAK